MPTKILPRAITALALLPALFSLAFSCQSNDSNNSNDSTTPTSTPPPSDLTSSHAIFKIATQIDPTSLDPRKVRDLPTITTLRLLFEGLVRSGTHGSITPAIAKTIDISPDGSRYTFTLRDTFWSNGEPLTAHDFEYSWKSVLDPQFPAPNAYQFYVIKGAQEAKEGKAPLSSVSIKAVDSKTLVVDLLQPTPYFLELIAFHAFFPVNPVWDKLPALEKDSPHHFIGNGPFIPATWAHHNVLVAKKNPHYWNAHKVSLDEIQVMTLDANTALQMYEAGSLDWTGSPLSAIPSDAIAPLKKIHLLGVAPAAGVHWFRFNVDRPPFNHVKMRQAFSYALNRKALTEHVLQGGQTPAMSIVPLEMGLHGAPYFKDHYLSKAQALFGEALTDLGLTKEQLPTITLSYINNERGHQIAQVVQQEWNQAFGINIKLESFEAKVYFDKIAHHDYQLSSGSWFADIGDPINFLEVFKSKNNATNNTQWENEKYAQLLDQSSRELDPHKRKEILKQAEALLMEEMPIAPLFYYSYNYVKKPEVQDVHFSELGYLDFVNAFFDSQVLDTTPD